MLNFLFWGSSRENDEKYSSGGLLQLLGFLKESDFIMLKGRFKSVNWDNKNFEVPDSDLNEGFCSQRDIGIIYAI